MRCSRRRWCRRRRRSWPAWSSPPRCRRCSGRPPRWAAEAGTGDVLEASTLLLLTARGHYAASALLTWLRVAGEYVVARTAVTARRSLHEVIAPPDAVVPRVEDGRTRPVRVLTLGIGDVIIVGAGERLPVDGTVVRGEALVNQQTMTGEALPVERRAGDIVFAATSVEHGEIGVRVDRVGLDTAVGRIVQAIERTADEKSDIQAFAERAGRSRRRPDPRPGRPRHRGLAQPRRRDRDPGLRLRHGRPRRHSHRDHQLHRPCLPPRHPHQGSPGARESRPGRHRRLRQDGDAHGGRTARDAHRAVRPAIGGTRSLRWWRPPSGRSAIPWPAPWLGSPPSAASPSPTR